MPLTIEPHLEEGIYHGQLDAAGKMPVSLFLPQAYEPRYAYPLLVFLHGHGERESQWMASVPVLSRRNYIAIGLRGPHLVTRRDGDIGYGWGRNRRCDGALEDYVLTAVRETMRICHIHSERIFLAGICEGATIAYRIGFSMPESFAGVVALNGWVPAGGLPLYRSRIHRGLRTFIGHGQFNTHVPAERADEAYRLLYAAGVAVQLRYYPTDHRLNASMLRDVDRWLIDACQ